MRDVWSHFRNLCSLQGILFIFTTLLLITDAQFPRLSNDSTIITISSPVNPNITIAFKTPPIGTCTTVFSTQKQFTGYIKLPANILSPTQGNFTINTFFWFIEARQVPENAPFTVFMNGGPGSSSMVGMFQEVGPCKVVEVARGKLGTIAREWGWDRSSNILFIDQPVQVGLSFDTLNNGSLNLLSESIFMPPVAAPLTQPSFTFLNGTFSSGDAASTANTSQLAAQSVWHLLQTFLVTFPEYNPRTRPSGAPKSSNLGINIVTESYGGKYGPSIVKFFRQQNILRSLNPALANMTLELTVASLSIINGWIDLLTQIPYYPRFAYNNSYGIQAVSQVQQLNSLSALSAPDGCRDRTLACRNQEAGFDPFDKGSSTLVNSLCSEAAATCQNDVIAPYLFSGRSIYDISQGLFDPFPDSFYLDYLNTLDVQQAIGTTINFTQVSLAVATAFNRTGDYARDEVLGDLSEALQNGTRIALIYGDRDYICNWVGGEAISFALAGLAGSDYRGWYGAGYAPIVTNNTYIGGVVREFGNLSFSRIYDAGHLVPAYQPETAFTVYSRIIQGVGISLGNAVNLSSFASLGDLNSTHKNTAPSMNSPKCFIRAVNATCDVDQKNRLANGAGIVINGVLYSAETDWKPPPASLGLMAGSPGTAPANMISSIDSAMTQTSSLSLTGGNSQSSSTMTITSRIPTGVFTATVVPNVTSTTTSSIGASILWRRSNFVSEYDTHTLVLITFGLLALDFT